MPSKKLKAEAQARSTADSLDTFRLFSFLGGGGSPAQVDEPPPLGSDAGSSTTGSLELGCSASARVAAVKAQPAVHLIQFLVKTVTETIRPHSGGFRPPPLVPVVGSYEDGFDHQLHKSVMDDDPSGIKEAVEVRGSKVDQWCSPAGMSELQWAAIAGKTNAIRALVDLGANLEFENTVSGNALCCATHYGQTESVRVLLECNADPGHKQAVPWFLKYLIPTYHGNAAMHFACGVNENPAIVRALLTARADPLQTNAAGQTCFHVVRDTEPGNEIKAILYRWVATVRAKFPGDVKPPEWWQTYVRMRKTGRTLDHHRKTDRRPHHPQKSERPRRPSATPSVEEIE